MSRLLSTLYLLTSLVLLSTGFGFFAEDYVVLAAVNRSDIRLPTSDAILDFTAPTLFLLASALSFWSKRESNRARWITAAAVLIMLAPLLSRESGWRLFLETAGPLISAVFVLDSLLRRPATIAIIAVGICGITQGEELVFGFERYWTFGGSVSTFLAKVTPLFLVAASLIAAISSLIATRKKALVQGNS